MCLFKEKEFREAKKYNLLVGIGIFTIALAIGIPFITNPGEDLVPKFTLAQLALSSVAFIIILVTLCFSIVHLRKAMAKPQLKLVFGKDKVTSGNEKTEKIINASKDKDDEVSLYLWVKNTGDAVAKLFQINFEVPSIFEFFDPNVFKSKQDIPSKLSPDRNSRIYSFYNDKEVYFVNEPKYVGSVTLALYVRKYKKYKKEYKIPYRVFGDWAETQEGKLKIICRKK